MSDLADANVAGFVVPEEPAARGGFAISREAILSVGLPAAAILAAIACAFFTLFKALPVMYLDNEGYYSHGLFMPFAAGYVIYRNWDVLRPRPVRGSHWALLPLALVLALLRPSSIADMQAFMSILLVLALLAGVWFVAGWTWLKGVTLPVAYLLFGLPIWSMAINSYTNPLQLFSTKVAFAMLSGIGMDPLRDGTVIHLNHFNLDVGVPCSGLKLIVALSAFTCFFMMIARLRWWSNVFLGALVVPLALLFNGLRIAMIGYVGETWGEAAGHQFHDYSGYIMLGVCFLTFFQIARWLGWKQ